MTEPKDQTTGIPESGPHILIDQIIAGKRHLHLCCQKCHWQWTPRTGQLPKVCPSCKSHQYHLDKVPGVGRPKGGMAAKILDQPVLESVEHAEAHNELLSQKNS